MFRRSIDFCQRADGAEPRQLWPVRRSIDAKDPHPLSRALHSSPHVYHARLDQHDCHSRARRCGDCNDIEQLAAFDRPERRS